MAFWLLYIYGAFTHTLRWDGLRWYFNGGVHTLSYQHSPSRPIPSQRVCKCTIRLYAEVYTTKGNVLAQLV